MYISKITKSNHRIRSIHRQTRNVIGNGKKVAVVLSGAGFLDGSEVQETVFLVNALSEHGAEVVHFAPDVTSNVVDHNKGSVEKGTRKVIAESGLFLCVCFNGSAYCKR